MIPFNIPPYSEKSIEYIKDAISLQKICGDGKYTKLCDQWMEERFHSPRVLLTTSCTSATEMAAILLDIHEGDEVICPSYTFVSSANPFVLRGARIVFVDIRPDTMNIDENKIEDAITEHTKAIVVVHYAGVSCNMDRIMEIAEKHDLPVVEDAAQGVMSSYRGKALGTIGTFGCYSFHETKNYSMGEGGALLIRDQKYIERAEIIREKGTNRSQFYRGQVDKYTWKDIGSSVLPSDMLAAYLWAQLEEADEINNNRLDSWNRYHAAFQPLKASGLLELPTIPDGCQHNAHMYYIKCRDLQERTSYIDFMKQNGILTVFHYVPLHSSPEGKMIGRFSGKDEYTTRESERLVRLPMYFGLRKEDQQKVIDTTFDFFGVKR